MMTFMERAAKAGYRPGAVACTGDGVEVVLFSYPYTDGRDIFVLGLTKPNDRSSWNEFRLDEIVLPGFQRTPVMPDK
jgi:hypothetical protein